jgi:hypothetical protein
MHTVLFANPASPPATLKSLRERARRDNYLIAADCATGTFSLIDARLHRPIAGYEHVDLPTIAHGLEVVQLKP